MGATKPLWFDREALASALGGREDHLGSALRAYLQRAPAMFAALTLAVEHADAARIELAARRVAGELLHLHARPAAAIARQIERAAAAGRVQGTPTLLSVLELATRELLVALVPLAVHLERGQLARVDDEPELSFRMCAEP
jgi:HPt (histidine-containing phosphotransfer) domain-containing protein